MIDSSSQPLMVICLIGPCSVEEYPRDHGWGHLCFWFWLTHKYVDDTTLCASNDETTHEGYVEPRTDGHPAGSSCFTYANRCSCAIRQCSLSFWQRWMQFVLTRLQMIASMSASPVITLWLMESPYRTDRSAHPAIHTLRDTSRSQAKTEPRYRVSQKKWPPPV